MFLSFNVGHEHCQDSPLIVSIMHSCYLARIHCPVHKADSWLCWRQGLGTYGVFCLWMMAIFQSECRTLLARRAPGRREGLAVLRPHSWASRLRSSSVRVRRSDLDCVSCVMFRIIVNTLYSITWILAPSTLSKHCELKLVTELRLNSSFQQRTFIKTSYSNSESVFWHLMKIWLTSTSLQRNAGNKNQDKTWK